MAFFNKKTNTLSPFTNEMLDGFRNQADPLADNVIKLIASKSDASIDELTKSLENTIRISGSEQIHDAIIKYFSHDEDICVSLENYFSQANLAPSWANTDKLVLGGKVFQDHVFSGFMMLACTSLPICYTCLPDVKVLSFTRRLINNTPKRIAETAQMITDVMGHGGIAIEDGRLTGKGIQSILKIRLIHACIRYLLLEKEHICAEHSHEHTFNSKNPFVAYILDSEQEKCEWVGKVKPTPWNREKDGLPINDEATALTLLTFSYLILRGLKNIGIKLTTEQQEAYLHSWNVVGHTLGVNEKFLTEFNTFKEAEAIFNQILNRRRGHSNDGELLQQALLDAVSVIAAKITPLTKLLDPSRLTRITTSILLSKENYAALGLTLSLYDRVLKLFIWMFLRIFGALVNWKLFRWLSDIVFKYISKSLWGWRKEYPENSTQKQDPHHPDIKQLLIPSHLVDTSFLAEKTLITTKSNAETR